MNKMQKKIIYIAVIVFAICLVVALCLWQNTDKVSSVEKQIETRIKLHPCQTDPAVNLAFSHVENLVVDTTFVYSSSDIANSLFFAPFIYHDYELWEYRIKVSKDSLEFFYFNECVSVFDAGIQVIYYVERSPFTIRENIICVQDYRIQILNDETLKVINLPKIPSGTILCCFRRLYDDKELKFHKRWKEGKKDGDWIYVDENGNVTVEVYENDSLLKKKDPTKEYLDWVHGTRWW